MKCKVGGRVIDFEVGAPMLSLTFADRRLIFTVMRETQFDNWVWVRLIVVGGPWPFVRHVAGFTSTNDTNDEEEASD